MSGRGPCPRAYKDTDAFLLICSAAKGIEEKDYEFSIDLYEEVVPEVRMHSICSEDCF